MALKPIFTPEAAAKILWRLILTDRAKIEDFDKPLPTFTGDPVTFRNLAREYPDLQHDPEVLADAQRYLDALAASQKPKQEPERVQVVSPRDFVPAPDPLPTEPNQELDGITTFTNHPDPTQLPF